MNKKILLLIVSIIGIFFVGRIVVGQMSGGITAPMYWYYDGSTYQQTITNANVSTVPLPTDNAHLANKEYVDLAVASIHINFFFTDTASDISTYFVIQENETGEAQSSHTSAALSEGDNQLIFSFATTAGLPFDRLPPGIFDGHYHLEKTGGAAKTVALYWELVHRADDTTETVLATSETSDAITSNGPFDLHLVLETEQAFSATDRLVVRLYANVSGGGATAQVIVYQEGLLNSHISSAIETETLSTIFLRLDGTVAMSGNLDMGTNNLINVGTITSGDITILDATPILVFKDSNSLGAASVGYIEWRDSGGGRAGFLGNNSSGNDDLYWKNEQGGNIGIETTGAGELQIFTSGLTTRINADGIISDHALSLDADLIMWLRMDDITGSTVNDVLDKNNGTLNGTAQQVDGLLGKSVLFDGNSDYIEVDDPDGSLDVDFAAFSVSVWVKPNFITSSANVDRVCDKYNGTDSPIRLMHTNTALWRFQVRAGLSPVADNCEMADVPWAINTWHLVTATYDGTNMRIYWDGVWKTTEQHAAGGVVDNAVGNLFIGTANVGAGWWHGEQDDFKFWKRKLTDDEITEIYELGVIDAETSFTKAYYKEYVASPSGFFNRLNIIESLDIVGSGRFGSLKVEGFTDPIDILDQNTDEGAFTDYQGIEGKGGASTIDTSGIGVSSAGTDVAAPAAANWACNKMIKVQINGTDHWIAAYTSAAK